jgi:hypothetical protein
MAAQSPDHRPSGKRFSPGKKGKLEDFGVIDARPTGPDDPAPGQQRSEGKPINLREHKLWQEFSQVISRGWGGYTKFLLSSFVTLTRESQVQLITNGSLIVTVGIAMLVLCFIYRFLPLPARVVGVPVVLGAAWWLGANIVSDVLIERFDRYLNR